MASPDAGRIAVVTPVYEDRRASARVFGELHAVLGNRAYVVAVDDGSVREPADRQDLAASGVEGVVLALRRNVGHQRAIALGLSFVADEVPGAEYVVVMDSDGEDIPATIPVLLEPLGSDNVDVVVAARRGRVASHRFRVFYRLYRALFRLLTGHSMSFGNFMAMKPGAVRSLVARPETPHHLAASVLTSGLHLEYRALDRGPRYAGTSKMNFRALARHGARSLDVFAPTVRSRARRATAGLASAALICTSLLVAPGAGRLTELTEYLAVGVVATSLLLIGLARLVQGARLFAHAHLDYRTVVARELHVSHARRA